MTFRFRNFSVSKLFNFFGGFGFGIEKIWYRKKYRIRYRKKLVSKKSIGFGIGKIWYRKKVSDLVPFIFWVSSHTAPASGVTGSSNALLQAKRLCDDVRQQNGHEE